MQSKMLSTFLCSAVVAGCLFAQPQGSEPVQGGGFSFGSFLDEPNDTRPDFAPGEPRAPRPGEPRAPRAEAPQPAQINTYQLGTVEVTAPRQPDENPTVVTVSADDMKKQGSRDAAEALRFTPGVFYMPSNTYPGTVYIRGFTEEETGFYFDGIPINDIYAGNSSGDTDLTPYTTFGLSAIQVSKGYTSPAFSGGKMGGALNMVSSVPVRNLEVNLGYKFIANNEHRINAQVGRNLGNQYFQLTFSRFDRKSMNYSYDYSGMGPVDIEGTEYKSYMLMGKYGFYIGDNHEYSLNFYHQHAKRGDGVTMFTYPFYDKTTFYVLGDSKFSDMVSLNSKVWYHMNMNQSAGKWSRATANPNTTGKAAGKTRVMVSGWGVAVGTVYNPDPTNYDNGYYWAWSGKYNDHSIGITETLKFDFSENQNLKIGFMVKNESHEATDWDSDYKKRDWQVLNHSYFAEYALRANDMLRFALNASYDRHDGLNVRNRERDDLGKWLPLSHAENKHLWGWNLQGIAYFNPVEALTFHANVGHKTNLPKIRGLYSEDEGTFVKNSDLTSESLINYEVGVDFGYVFGSVGTASYGATAYFNDISNMIVTLDVSDNTRCAAGANCIMFDNAYDGYSVGGEVYAKQGFFGDALTLGVNWSYLHRRSSISKSRGEGTKGSDREFTTHPRQNINMLVQIAPSRDYDINLVGSVQTSRYAYVNVAEGYVKLPTVVFFDLTTNYRLTKRLSLTAGAYNLFDRNYNYETSYADAVAGGFPGRRVFAGFEYNYHR
jgi:iron complex outermembrane recepter protein